MAKPKQTKPAKPAEFIHIHEDVQVEIIPLNRIQLNPNNPKKPMSKDRKKGLNRSLTEFGFKGVVLVAPHPDEPDDYVVLDGNTRMAGVVLDNAALALLCFGSEVICHD